MITWTEAQLKCQTISGDFTSNTLTQFKQDMNIAYHRFNNSLGRYFSRKQQFTDIINGQSIYQTPIDSIRVIGMTLSVGNSTYKQVLKEVRSESEWRTIKAYPYNNNWPVAYFVLGNDEIEIWPTPSQDVTNGIRFYYQQQDYDLSIEDVTSTGAGATVSVTNGSSTVTATSGVFNANYIGCRFQLTGVNNLFWYEVVDVPAANTLTLKSAFVGNSGSGLAWRIGQTWITPDEYSDVPIDYALHRFFESRNNASRSAYHKKNYDDMVQAAVEDYTSSTEGNVIFEDSEVINSWLITPLPGTS